MQGSPADLQSRLQASVGAAYRVEKELGGGGMSRVFLAEEVRLGRRVVIKLLPPEMTAGVNVERFEREIQLAARLQHPHLVPLLTAGAEGDLLYYIMPFIEGESLRARLAREGELPIGEVVRILKEVLDALQYAHSHRVVHRDIKPDNVLLSGKHALVTDFGVAKAVSESTGESSLTSLGVALGTPAYMAPEQAAGDPNVDHRADIYAVGVLAYEMLTGRPPFTGSTPQSVLAKHITQAPEPATTHRPTVPPALDELILRCLHKKAADRPQRADELVPTLDALLTRSGGLTPTSTQPVAAVDYHARARRSHPARVAALFALAAVGVLAIVYLLVQQMGLPDWVFQGAIALLVAGFPIVLTTGWLERRRARLHATGMRTATPVGLARHATWKKAFWGGALAFGGLALVAALFMASRLLGIGPGATLLSAGVLGDQERLILADFENQAGDSALVETVTELVRIALAQSQAVTVLEPGQVGSILRLMSRDAAEAVTAPVAAEIAAREGIKAYVTGEVRSLGSGYVISTRLVEATTSSALLVVRETATDPAEIIAAVDRMAATMRQKIGESLRSVRAQPSLEQLTTTSLGALRLYAQAERLQNRGDFDQAVALLEQAVAQDSTFAMAWRRLGVFYLIFGGAEGLTRMKPALQRAHDLRGRLSERERYFVEAAHAFAVLGDHQQAITAYLAILEKHPLDPTALNNAAVSYVFLGREEEALVFYRRAIDANVASAVSYGNLIDYLAWSGQLESADTLLRLARERFPDHSRLPELKFYLALARQNFGAADSAARAQLASVPQQRVAGHNGLAQLAWIQGRLAEAGRERNEALRLQGQRTGEAEAETRLVSELNGIERELVHATDRSAISKRLEHLWSQNRELTVGRPASARRYNEFVWHLSRSGNPEWARRILDEFRRELSDRERSLRDTQAELQIAEASVAMAEGRFDTAIAGYREACRLWRGTYAACDQGAFPWLGEAYDRAGQADSAIAVWERWVGLQARNVPGDWAMLAPFSRRLGELYEAKGEARKAIESYSLFTELWRNADPVLQPQVRDVRERITRLTRDAG